jgi:hypothetical protein
MGRWTPITTVSCILLLIAAVPTLAASDEVSMKFKVISDDVVLTKENLDRVKKHIIQTGSRCTYSNIYNNNPCLQTKDFDLYLNPDPGPDGHPQWNINCDVARGDFNTLVVRDRVGDGPYGIVEFMRVDRVVIKTNEEASGGQMNRIKQLLRTAVLVVLADAQAGR